MFPDINEYFYTLKVPPSAMDKLWAAGWRHFGALFFRYSRFFDGVADLTIVPLRINVNFFRLSKSQRRIIRKNQDLKLKIQRPVIDDQRKILFEHHKTRFKINPPESLDMYLGGELIHDFVCKTLEFSVWLGDRLLAASYLDIGENSTSSIYAMFDPAFSKRCLGIYTMLLEIEYSKNNGFLYYYHGYTAVEPSAYDYKKHFSALEFYDWNSGKWKVYDKEKGFIFD
jgi:arginine-tRNA-protein transferase